MASMQSAMDLFLSSAMYAVHTSLPAKVEKYDAEKHTATVKPAVNMLMDNGVQIEIPSLMEVPVVFPASKFFDMEFPLDEATAFFCFSRNPIFRHGKTEISRPFPPWRPASTSILP
jgi:hypothetical protein